MDVLWKKLRCLNFHFGWIDKHGNSIHAIRINALCNVCTLGWMNFGVDALRQMHLEHLDWQRIVHHLGGSP